MVMPCNIMLWDVNSSMFRNQFSSLYFIQAIGSVQFLSPVFNLTSSIPTLGAQTIKVVTTVETVRTNHTTFTASKPNMKVIRYWCRIDFLLLSTMPSIPILFLFTFSQSETATCLHRKQTYRTKNRSPRLMECKS